MERLSIRELLEFYKEHVFGVLMPFWMRFGIDRGRGGFFTCFNNAGDRLVSQNKYIWSQGRFLWMLSRLAFAFRDYVDAGTASSWLEAAGAGARFLKEHALLPDGHCVWVLDREGRPILTDRQGRLREPKPGEGYDLGIAADEFLVYGLGEYSRAAQDPESFDFALRLFDSVLERLESGRYRNFPHDSPKGFRSHGKPMTLLETAQELADVARFFGHPAAARLAEMARKAMGETLGDFLQKQDKVLLEYIRQDGSTAYEEMLGSVVNPGHCLEDAWFIMHFAARGGDREALGTAVEVVRWMIPLGWDEEFGGLPQFVHKDGGPPRGRIAAQNEGDHMIVELRESWSNKLWWVHSEALYALILAYEHTRDPWFLDTYGKLHEYVFSTFPNPKREIGEWIQIRDRKGVPEDKVVALPVKDPYHLVRAFLHAIKSLERIAA